MRLTTSLNENNHTTTTTKTTISQHNVMTQTTATNKWRTFSHHCVGCAKGFPFIMLLLCFCWIFKNINFVFTLSFSSSLSFVHFCCHRVCCSLPNQKQKPARRANKEAFGRRDGLTNGWRDRQTSKWASRQTDGQTTEERYIGCSHWAHESWEITENITSMMRWQTRSTVGNPITILDWQTSTPNAPFWHNS